MGFPAPMAGKIWNAKVIARCGMIYGESVETLNKSRQKYQQKKSLSKNMYFKNADQCMIPTKELAEWVTENYKIPSDKINVIPNHVETELFKPAPNCKQETDIISVGRLVSKKNHDILIQSIAGSDINLTIIGQGKLKDSLRKLALEKEVKLTLIDRVENSELPQYFTKSKIYVNAASWEGHPKALLEAMSCGCACIVADSPGLKNQIRNRENGLIVNPTPNEILSAINLLLTDPDLRLKLGKNARKDVLDNFSLSSTYEKYKEIVNRLLPGNS